MCKIEEDYKWDWPCERIPAPSRTTNRSFQRDSRNPTPPRIKKFPKPRSRDEICQYAFRLQRDPYWSDPRRHYGSMDSSAYTPTNEYPFRGIWVGDYAAHGCEFLLLRQESFPIDPPMYWDEDEDGNTIDWDVDEDGNIKACIAAPTTPAPIRKHDETDLEFQTRN